MRLFDSGCVLLCEFVCRRKSIENKQEFSNIVGGSPSLLRIHHGLV